jgi:phosphoglycolate phosphatase
MSRAILFDLDGTLTDSGEGIINCAILALNHFGLPVPDRETLRVFVGPPLDETFMKFGVPADQTDEAIRVYRSRYTTVGKFENIPYPGIEELLQKLSENGHKLYVATSKPEAMSIEILEKFGLAKYFTLICGATLDGSRSKKADIISYLLEKAGGAENAIMVGDRKHDILGAHAVGIPATGVLYGYGDRAELEGAGATYIAETVENIIDFV